MNRVRIYFNKNANGSMSISAITGDVLPGGDAWTLVTNILRTQKTKKPAGIFVLGQSILGGDDVLGELKVES